MQNKGKRKARNKANKQEPLLVVDTPVAVQKRLSDFFCLLAEMDKEQNLIKKDYENNRD